MNEENSKPEGHDEPVEPTASQELRDDHGHDSTGHSKSHTGVFVTVFAMLCALTALSFWIANSPLMDNPMIGWGAMMAVSVAKAMLVILFFMHLWWERAWKYVLTIPALIMGVLLVILLVPDVGCRTETYSDERRANAPIAQEWTGGVAPRSDGTAVEEEVNSEAQAE